MPTASPQQKSIQRATSLIMLGYILILAVLLFIPTFDTLNGHGPGDCRFSQLDSSDVWFGPATMLMISRKYGDYGVFWGLAAPLVFSILAGYGRKGRSFLLNASAFVLNGIYSIVVLGAVLDKIGCQTGTFLQGIAVAGAIIGGLFIVIGSLLLFQREQLPPYAERYTR